MLALGPFRNKLPSPAIHHTPHSLTTIQLDQKTESADFARKRRI
jgi:hypothetical protein